MKLPKLVVTVCPAECIPKGYGIAYRLWDQDRAVCMPIPINIVAGGLYKFWWHLRIGLKPSIIEEVYRKGVAAGQSAGVNACIGVLVDELPKQIAQVVMEAQYQGTKKFFDERVAAFRAEEGLNQ